VSKKKNLPDIIENFKNTSILVIGDIILDKYIWGTVSRVSPEAPVPVVNIKKETTALGGAANVVHNVVSLGGKAHLVGIVGSDQESIELMNILKQIQVPIGTLAVDKNRPTTVKTRIIAHSQQVVRVDREKEVEISPSTAFQMLNSIKKIIDRVDAIVIEDYGKGVITRNLLKTLIPLAIDRRIPVAVDPKESHFRMYSGVTIITPNHYEAANALGPDTGGKNDIDAIGKKLLQISGSESVLITRGEEGMSLFQHRKKTLYIPTVAKEVYDVSGAGDTVISTIALALASGTDLETASLISNYAAGIAVGKVGVCAVTRSEILKALPSG